MNHFAKRIERNLRRKNNKSGRKVFEDYCFFITEGTNNSVADLIDMPIPLVMAISDKLNILNKQKAKANKK